MTRTEQLAKAIQKIAKKHQKEIKSLKYSGPKGGGNARYIEGWEHIGNGTITKACHLAGLPTMNYWSGKNSTPAAAFPECVAEEIREVYLQIFNPLKWAGRN